MSFMSFMSFYNEFRNELWQDSEQVLAPYVGVPQISFGTRCWAAGCPRRPAGSQAARPDPIARPAADRTVPQAGRKARSPQPGRCPRMPATKSCLPPSEVGPGNRSGWHAHGVVVDRHVSAIGGVIPGETGHLLTLCDTGGNGFLRACRASAVFLVKATSKSLSLSPRRPSFALLERFLITLLAHPPEPPECTYV